MFAVGLMLVLIYGPPLGRRPDLPCGEAILIPLIAVGVRACRICNVKTGSWGGADRTSTCKPARKKRKTLVSSGGRQWRRPSTRTHMPYP